MDTRKLGCSLFLITLLAFLPILSGYGAGSGLVSQMQAQTLWNSPTGCSAATLRGEYGLFEQGTIFVPLPWVTTLPPFPTADVVIITYDGAGHFSGSYTANDAGYPGKGTFNGTYSVNADCTYTGEYVPSVLPITFHLAGVIEGQGMKQEIHYLYTDPFLVSWGTGKKTPPGGCSVASLKGTYGDSEQATVVFNYGAPPAYPAAGSGTFTFDGKGKFSGNVLLSFGGQVSQVVGTGKYTVNPDCTYSDVFTDTSGFTSHDAGIIVGQGEFQELHMIYADEGVVDSVSCKKIHTAEEGDRDDR
jgi:hypothetical protein